jgi:predicted nucleotidyltransferase
MTLPNEISDYLKYIVSTIKAVMPVTAIYLFGSYADGTYRKDRSDLDIYVITSDKSKRRLEWMRIARMSFDKIVNIPLDLVVNYEDRFEERSKSESTLEYQVITKGVTIHDYK